MAASEPRGGRAPIEFQLKALTAPDCDAAVALALGAYEELCAFKGGEELALAMWASLMASLADGRPRPAPGSGTARRSVAFEFKHGPDVIGLGILDLQPTPHGEAEAFIYLRADQRGRGAGSALLGMLDSWARSEGSPGVFFRVPPGAREAKNLGERNGYRARTLKMRRSEGS
ncbi:MAG: GNAT family N-acetyltransferase [Actinomycetota bacterium]|nr:GNAT family N-acetyltransferase [Actinomycetota bacterium]